MDKFQTPKGTRDFLPEDMILRQRVIDSLVSVYKIFGFRAWDGPAFEYLETLTKKSGEDVASEIYAFKDKSGRELGLRFELTTSLARIIANNSNFTQPFKLYNIGKVWRYERPQAGRFREFLQADTDIFGSEEMTCEVELLVMAAECLRKLGLEDCSIVLNNRKILEAALRVVKIEPGKEPEVLRALDKLSKIGEAGVREEFEKRGLPVEQFEKLIEFVKAESGDNNKRLAGALELVGGDEGGIKGVKELQEILEGLNSSGFKGRVDVDLSLVRGLDYYTGPIFEIRSGNEEVGSIAGGGRYDELVEIFGGKPTPATGISFGIERLIEILASKPGSTIEPSPIKVFVANSSPDDLFSAMKAVAEFRKAGIPAEYDLMKRNLGKQLNYANASKIPFCFIILSQTEQKLKNMSSGEEESITLENAIQKLAS